VSSSFCTSKTNGMTQNPERNSEFREDRTPACYVHYIPIIRGEVEAQVALLSLVVATNPSYLCIGSNSTTTSRIRPRACLDLFYLECEKVERSCLGLGLSWVRKAIEHSYFQPGFGLLVLLACWFLSWVDTRIRTAV
jgi:hypothetical protein